MAYTNYNFKTKKALKQAVADPGSLDKVYNLKCHQPGLGPDLSNYTGRVYLEGPHYPAAHTWYAEAELKDGIVVKVR